MIKYNSIYCNHFDRCNIVVTLTTLQHLINFIIINVQRLVNHRAVYKLHVTSSTRLQLVYAPFDTAITSVHYHGNLKGNNAVTQCQIYSTINIYIYILKYLCNVYIYANVQINSHFPPILHLASSEQ